MPISERKIALITGAGRQNGIGAATALALARAGIDVFITTYTPYDTRVMNSQPDEAEGLLTEIRALDVRVARMEIDLSQADAAQHLFDEVEAALGAVDILINNAAYSINAGIDDLTAEIIDQHYAMNLRGMMLLCHEFVRRWRKTSGGKIINHMFPPRSQPKPRQNLARPSSAEYSRFWHACGADRRHSRHLFSPAHDCHPIQVCQIKVRLNRFNTLLQTRCRLPSPLHFWK